MSNGFEREIRWRNWLGLRIIEITALPREGSPRLTFDMISECYLRKVSIDFVLSSSEQKLRFFVVLRCGERQEKSVAMTLNESQEAIKAILNGGGFIVKDPEEDPIELMESLMPSQNTSAALFYAKEPQCRFYIPANPNQLPAFDYEGICRNLARSKKCVCSISLIPTLFMPEEVQTINNNIGYFGGLSPEIGRVGINAYTLVQKEVESQMLFLVCSANGESESLRSIKSVMNGEYFSVLDLTDQQKELLGDSLTYPMECASILSEYGHSYHEKLSSSLRRLSHMMTHAGASQFISLAGKTENMMGFQITEEPTAASQIPDEMKDSNGIYIGKTDQGQELYLPINQLPKHVCITGMPGMGKTSFAIGLLNQIWKKGYPFIIIEPTKQEYRSMIDIIPELQIFTAGKSDVCQMPLNPFLPPKGVTLEQYKPSLTSVFLAAFSMTSPLDVIFPDVINTCYARYGWRNNSTRDSEGVEIFGLNEFIEVFQDCVARSQYDPESKANLESGGTYRLKALLNTNSALFDTDLCLPYDEMLEHPILIELDAIDNQEQKALVISILLINLMLAIRNKQLMDGEIKNVIMIDEAHLLLGNQLGPANSESAKSSASVIQMLQNMVVTIRAYGTGLIFADQSPQKLTEEIINNCNLKVSFRLDNAKERYELSKSIELSKEQKSNNIAINKSHRPIKHKNRYVNNILYLFNIKIIY